MLINRSDLADNSYEVFKKYAEALRQTEDKPDGGAASFDDIQAIIQKKK